MVTRRTSTEIPARHEEHDDLYWSSSTPSSGISRRLEGRPRPPYIGWHALGYKSVSIYPTRLQHEKLIRTALNCLDCLILYTKYLHVLGPHVRSGRVHGQVSGSSGRSGPPVGDG
jgi:hypothetical protein